MQVLLLTAWQRQDWSTSLRTRCSSRKT